jgi:hypothetical protein
MACLNLSTRGFLNEVPSYLRKILAEINNGDNEELKTCACQMQIVRAANEGCIIVDENNRVALFPFCLINGVPPETGPGTNYPISFNLADFTKWYWTGDKFRIKFTWSGTERGDCGRYGVFTQTSDFGPQESEFITEKDQKKRVCNIGNSSSQGSASISGEVFYYWPNICENLDCCCASAGGECPDPYTVGGSAGFGISISFDQSYVEDDGTVWPKIQYNGFSNTPCGNPSPKVDNALSAGIRANFEGESLDPLYFCWSPSWGPDAAWGWTGSINMLIEITYL